MLLTLPPAQKARPEPVSMINCTAGSPARRGQLVERPLHDRSGGGIGPSSWKIARGLHDRSRWHDRGEPGGDRWFADSSLEESGFQPLVPLATEMLIEL